MFTMGLVAGSDDCCAQNSGVARASPNSFTRKIDLATFKNRQAPNAMG